MIYNPFNLLGIQPTKNKQVIADAYENAHAKLVINGGTEQDFWELKNARQDCEMYALENGDIDLFTEFDRN